MDQQDLNYRKSMKKKVKGRKTMKQIQRDFISPFLNTKYFVTKIFINIKAANIFGQFIIDLYL
jgi:hypothetical protein